MQLFLFAKVFIALVYGLDVRRRSLVWGGLEVGGLSLSWGSVDYCRLAAVSIGLYIAHKVQDSVCIQNHVLGEA